MSKNLLIGLAIAAVVISTALLTQQTSENQDEFTMWKSKFQNNWSQSEDTYRRIIFLKNLERINKHNADSTQTYKMGLTQFAALTDAEFSTLHLTPKPYNPEWEHSETGMPSLGADIDWTQKNVVSPVKNQGNCGSCWAFSAVATLESFALMNGKTAILSEQQLVDCSKKYGNDGCNGGFNYQGLAYVKDHGIATGADYPYAAKTQACKVDGGAFKIASVSVAKGCPAVLSALASRTLGVSVDATNWSHYASGVFNNCKTSLNHDVFLVGATDAYWKIKNSWGTSWGESGFIRLATGNTCGICLDKSPWPV
jgi:cathepsin L